MDILAQYYQGLIHRLEHRCNPCTSNWCGKSCTRLPFHRFGNRYTTKDLFVDKSRQAKIEWPYISWRNPFSMYFIVQNSLLFNVYLAHFSEISCFSDGESCGSCQWIMGYNKARGMFLGRRNISSRDFMQRRGSHGYENLQGRVLCYHNRT